MTAKTKPHDLSGGEGMISVIVPAHNEEGVIGKCLEGLKQQDFRGKMEIIVVDNGSSDRTVQEAKKFKGVRVVLQKNRGPAAARNLGVEKSRGDIILFTDADCVPERDWVRQMVAPFSCREIVGVQGAYKTWQKELMARFSQIEIEDRYERMKRFENLDFIGTYSAGYRKEVFRGKGFDESFPLASGEDSEFSLRIAKSGQKMVFNPDAVVYHQHPSSLGEYLKVKFFRACWRVLLYRKHKGKMVRESYTPQGLKLQIGLFYMFFASLVLSLFWEWLVLVAVSLYVLLILSAVPFSARAFRKDSSVGLASIIVLQLRSIIFSLGLVEGIIRGGRK